MLADDGEDAEEVGDAEELADALAEVVELKGAAGGLGGDDQAHEGAEAHTVDVGEVGEVEDDSLVVCHQLADAGVEVAADFGDEAAVAVDESGVGLALDIEREDAVGCRIGHWVSLFEGGTGNRGLLFVWRGNEKVGAVGGLIRYCRVECMESPVPKSEGPGAPCNPMGQPDLRRV